MKYKFALLITLISFTCFSAVITINSDISDWLGANATSIPNSVVAQGVDVKNGLITHDGSYIYFLVNVSRFDVNISEVGVQIDADSNSATPGGSTQGYEYEAHIHNDGSGGHVTKFVEMQGNQAVYHFASSDFYVSTVRDLFYIQLRIPFSSLSLTNSIKVRTIAFSNWTGFIWNSSDISLAVPYSLGSIFDTTAPTISAFYPQANAVLPAGTDKITLSVSTNENSECKYSTQSNSSFNEMILFSQTGSTLHNTTILDLVDGMSYDYYVKCSDTRGNKNQQDYQIHFSVSTAFAVDINANPTIGSAPLQVHFNATISGISSNTGLSYNWDFGDGFVSPDKTTSHIYTLQGTYYVHLTVIDAQQHSASDSTSIAVLAAGNGTIGNNSNINNNNVSPGIDSNTIMMLVIGGVLSIAILVPVIYFVVLKR